jgi:predicted metalloprotease with PDZ domain
MSQLAPFVDRAASGDRTNFDNTFISYYTWGSVIAMGLDLTLRERTDGRVSLDDFMRALWERHTMDNLKTALASVSGDAAFAHEFFARYIEGRDVVDVQKLVSRAGLVWRPVAPGRAYAGALRVQETPGGARIVEEVLFGSHRAIATRKPGDPLPVVYERRGERFTSALSLVEDPHRELVAVEDVGQTLTDEQRRFRDRWLSAGF